MHYPKTTVLKLKKYLKTYKHIYIYIYIEDMGWEEAVIVSGFPEDGKLFKRNPVLKWNKM